MSSLKVEMVAADRKVWEGEAKLRTRSVHLRRARHPARPHAPARRPRRGRRHHRVPRRRASHRDGRRRLPLRRLRRGDDRRRARRRLIAAHHHQLRLTRAVRSRLHRDRDRHAPDHRAGRARDHLPATALHRRGPAADALRLCASGIRPLAPRAHRVRRQRPRVVHARGRLRCARSTAGSDRPAARGASVAARRSESRHCCPTPTPCLHRRRQPSNSPSRAPTTPRYARGRKRPRRATTSTWPEARSEFGGFSASSRASRPARHRAARACRRRSACWRCGPG